MANERLATYMKPDYTAWKAARDRLSTQLRTQQRLTRAEATRQRTNHMNEANTASLQGLEELHGRLVSDSSLRESENKELKRELVGIIKEKPENELAIGCLALLSIDNMDSDQQILYVGLLPALMQACNLPPTRSIAIWLVARLCKAYSMLADAAMKLQLVPLLFTLSILKSTTTFHPHLLLSHTKPVLSLIQTLHFPLQIEALALSEKTMTASPLASYYFCQFGMLPVLEKLMGNEELTVAVLWNLSILCQNLAVDFVWEIVNLKLFPNVLGLLMKGKYSLLEPGIWVFINLISHNISDITTACIEWQIAAAMLSIAERTTGEIAALALDCVLVLLECLGKEEAQRFLQEGLRIIVESLQWSRSKEVASRAETIIELFCEEPMPPDLSLDLVVGNFVF